MNWDGTVAAFLARFGDPVSKDYSEHVYITTQLSPEFAAHLAACLSEGMCPAAHKLTVPEPMRLWAADPGTDLAAGAWEYLGTSDVQPECRQCQPVSRWKMAPHGWTWEPVKPFFTFGP
jgi:hypothetical protein